MDKNKYRKKLRARMDRYVRFVYSVTKKFPKEEIYGITSQFRRAALSVILNYIEGYARRKHALKINFFEISYGSLQESKYLWKISLHEKYIIEEEFKKGTEMAEEIGTMLWTEIKNLDKVSKKNS